jgi:carbamoyl-phosphate synthase large subunit
LPDEKSLQQALTEPTDTRLYAVLQALTFGWSIEKINDMTHIDKWFLARLREVVDVEKDIRQNRNQHIDKDKLRRWKVFGFSDVQIASLSEPGKSPKDIQSAAHKIRLQRLELGIRPYVKKIDTTAGEYPAQSNYLYLTYVASFDDEMAPLPNSKSVLILGSGAYRIGTSVEFDWCAVSCSQKLQSEKFNSIILNCNPETVSTDYNASNHLYFDEMTLERILDIVAMEKIYGVVSSMGGQLPNRLALPLAQAGVNLLGHSAATIDMAEDRSKFSALLDELKIDQPEWIAASSRSDVDRFVEKAGFPLLVRPSYVLSGAAMKVAFDRTSLDQYLFAAAAISVEHPVVISQFLEGAREIELDGVASKGEILTAVVSEHIENAGVHSGDATMVVPAQKLYVETIRRVRKAAKLIASGLKLNGPFNIQFLARSNHIQVIECNARASRSFPFVSKVVGVNLADTATAVMLGHRPRVIRFNEDELPHVGVKAALFSFTRLPGVDPLLGVEMSSTGEVGCIGSDFEAAYLLAMESSKIYPPCKAVLVSAGSPHDKIKFVPSAKKLMELGLKMYATPGTAKFLKEQGIECEEVAWPGQSGFNAIDAIQSKKVDFVINIPKNLKRDELTNGGLIRQAATKYGCSLLTNMEKTNAYVQALDHHRQFLTDHDVRALPEYQS